ncbi:MAG TPA: hypothetical protein VKZ59_01935 [Acidobacteriota bacterium]|nr:hypothetical protein [Acidobacteriota bacterium]
MQGRLEVKKSRLGNALLARGKIGFADPGEVIVIAKRNQKKIRVEFDKPKPGGKDWEDWVELGGQLVWVANSTPEDAWRRITQEFRTITDLYERGPGTSSGEGNPKQGSSPYGVQEPERSYR